MSDFYKNERFELNGSPQSSKPEVKKSRGILKSLLFFMFQFIKILGIFIFSFLFGMLRQNNHYNEHDPKNSYSWKHFK